MKNRRGQTKSTGDKHRGGRERRPEEAFGGRAGRDSPRADAKGGGQKHRARGDDDARREGSRPRHAESDRTRRAEPDPTRRIASAGTRHTEPDQLRRTESERTRHSESERARPAGSDGAHVFGVQPVLEILRAGLRPVERITVAEGAHEARLQEIIELARAAGVPVRRVPRTELQHLTAGANHQGVVATVAAARYRQTDELLDALAARVGTEDPPLALVLDGVEDPRNLGAIIRTAECAGAHGVFVPERRAAGLTETVAKAAAGALEYVPVARAANVVRLIEELKKRGVWTIGTASEARTPYTGWDWTQPCALLLGGEGEGLRRLVRERCDVLVSVPLRGEIESLNVSVAAGVVLYEAVRQRTAAREAAYNDAREGRTGKEE